MAKPKDKLAKATPQQRSRPTKAPKEAPAKTSKLSTEYVVDSDDEDAAPEDKEVRTKAKKKVVSQPAPLPAAKQAPVSKPKQNGVTSVRKTASVEDEEGTRESESSDEEPSESENEQEAQVEGPAINLPATTNGVKRTASEASSSSEDSDSEEESKDEEPAVKRSRTDSGTADTRGRRPATPASSKQAGAQIAIAGPISAKPYQPPFGYTALDISVIPHSSSFTRSALAGKQIWHIAAPSDIPLASIKEVAADAILSGRPVLNHRNTDYFLSEAGPGSDTTVVFAPDKGSFRPLEQRVEKTFQLQQHISLPNLTSRQANIQTGSKAAADVAQAPVSSIRPQPKGLRMRYRPPGYGSGDPGMIGSDSDSDAQDGDRPTQKSFQFPRALGAHGTSEHRDPPATPNGPAAKPKKKRKEKLKDGITETPLMNGHSHEVSAVAGVSHQDGVTASVAAMPAKKVVAPEAVNGDVTMTDAATTPQLSKEDKARRKEEKRLRKEAKMKGRAS